ncbi:MAG: quinolinate synthase NadA [Bacteroidales bacterium]|nr:quinolinate synthase NadA [Bacteroidales bacterium]
MEIKQEWKDKGYIDEPIPAGFASAEGRKQLADEIRRIAKEKNAVILAHYYTEGAVQDVADFVGDSLALAQKAAKTDADIIVMCGVHFMGETCKILCPTKTVICPDVNATCSLAESCPADRFEAFVKAHPDHKVISYVNTTAATKAWTDVVVTSSNARQIVDSFPKDEKLIFGPDRNLGAYINSITGREMLLWDGACHVHERFSLEKLLALKAEHPEAKVLVHPECKGAIAKVADVVGSTAALLKYSVNSDDKEFLVVTESGILHEMQRQAPEKTFIPVPPEDSLESEACSLDGAHAQMKCCACNECNYMRMLTLEKLYNSLRYEWPTVEVDSAISAKAIKPINRMLDISAKLGL